MAVPNTPDSNESTKAIVAIIAVNLQSGQSDGYNPQIGAVQCFPTVQPAGILNIPAVGEQWIAERIGLRWFLMAKTDVQDSRVAYDYELGMVALGNTTGPTIVGGSRVELNSPKVTMRGVETRLAAATTYIGDYGVRVNPATGLLQTLAPGAGQVWTNVDSPQTTPTTPTQLVHKVHKYRLLAGTGTRSVPTNTYVVLPYATRTTDDDAGVFTLTTSGSGTGELVCQKAGKYFCQARIGVDATNATPASTLYGYLFYNTTLIARTSGGPTNSWLNVEINEWLSLNVGDKVSVQTYYYPGPNATTQDPRTLQTNADGSGSAMNELVVSYLG